MKFPWTKENGSTFRAEMPDNVTLIVTPDQTKGFFGDPKRGTSWHAQASQYDDKSTTISRFGRDEYNVKHKTYKDAMRAAESIYNDAL